MNQSKIPRLSEELTSKTGFHIKEQELLCDYPTHWHEFYELEYITEGSGIVGINNTTRSFKSGSLFFLTSSDFEYIKIHEQTKLINVSFKSDWIDDKIINLLSSGLIIDKYKNRIFFDLLVNEYTEDNTLKPNYLKNTLNLILFDIVRNMKASSDENAPQKYSKPVIKSINYISMHFREQISLKEVADFAGLSPNYLSTLFQNELGISFINHLVNLRISHAARLLLINEGLTVTQVCFQSGFNDFSHFLRSFKKRYNMTPTQYRQNNASQKDKVDFINLDHTLHFMP